MGLLSVQMALDRSSTTSVLDRDGRLHCEAVPITRVQVADYRGSEIPSADELGGGDHLTI